MKAELPDLYVMLGVARDASPDDIKWAHRRLVAKHHPDKGGDAEMFRAVQTAFEALREKLRILIRKLSQQGVNAQGEKARLVKIRDRMRLHEDSPLVGSLDGQITALQELDEGFQQGIVTTTQALALVEKDGYAAVGVSVHVARSTTYRTRGVTGVQV